MALAYFLLYFCYLGTEKFSQIFVFLKSSQGLLRSLEWNSNDRFSCACESQSCTETCQAITFNVYIRRERSLFIIRGIKKKFYETFLKLYKVFVNSLENQKVDYRIRFVNANISVWIWNESGRLSLDANSDLATDVCGNAASLKRNLSEKMKLVLHVSKLPFISFDTEKKNVKRRRHCNVTVRRNINFSAVDLAHFHRRQWNHKFRTFRVHKIIVRKFSSSPINTSFGVK